MNILFLTRRFHPQIGGVETHVLEVGKKLLEKGHTIHVISEELSLKKVEQRKIDGIKITRIKVGQDNWFKKFRIWTQLFKIRSLISSSDIIHCHDVFFWYLPFRFIYPFKKVYTTFHGYETRFPISKKAIFIRKVSETLSNGNICIGNYIKKWYGTKPSFVSYGGVNQVINDISHIKFMNKKLKIILLGRLDRDIGINTYLKALDVLKYNKVNFKLEVFGEGAMKGKIEKYGKVLGFTGDISKAFLNADIVFCSSYLTMLEAMIRKKVVIAVYENHLKEDYLKLSPFVRYIFICKDESEIEQIIENFVNSPWKTDTMIEEGYKWAKKQTWDSVADEYIALWKS